MNVHAKRISRLTSALVFLCIVFFPLSCAEKKNTRAEVEADGHHQAMPAWLDTHLSFEDRTEALVAEMSTAEKIAQLYNEAPAIPRLGVAEYNWWNEALHGVARAGKATVFPQAIGLAATFDEALMFEVGAAIADEARAKHHYFLNHDVHFKYTGLNFWSPNINIFRDPRWGRGQETYGEDPLLTGAMAVKFIQGLQGQGQGQGPGSGPQQQFLKTAATLKHFAVHSGPEKTRHSDNYQATAKDFYETYLPAFARAIRDTEVEGVMCAYNRVNGEPACASEELLQKVLRDELNFKGHVVSDCGAIADIFDPTAHATIPMPAAAAAKALRSGTDLNCGGGFGNVYANLHFALQRGMISEAEIDSAVKRLFLLRFKLGMFDPPENVSYAGIPMSIVGSEKHLQLAERAAEKSLVLLKNDGLLPLAEGTKVAVIGPNADNEAVLLGNYNGDPIAPVSALKGIRQRAGSENVSYAPGSALIADIYTHFKTLNAAQLFHRDGNGVLQPGLRAHYQELNPPPGFAANEFDRIDANIDFYWQTSPLDGSVWDEFSVQWQGVLLPEESGEYEFQSQAEVSVDGAVVDGPVLLESGREYSFSAAKTFQRRWWGSPLEPSVKVRVLRRDRDLLAEAMAAVEKTDVIIYVGGISPRLEGEEMPLELAGFDHGDRTGLDLPAEQQSLLRAIKRSAKPLVVINFSGGALAFKEAQAANAIVQAFYPGEAAGTALARLLWGDFSPSGRLPVTFYKGVEDLPDFKDYRMAGRTYRYYEGEPLYAFGHGLSYTRFAYTDMQAPVEINQGQWLTFSATVTNVGTREADEVVQVYFSMPDAPLPTPQRALKSFERIHLQAGESRILEYTFDQTSMRYIDAQGREQAYEGVLEVSLGGGQVPFVQTAGAVSAKLLVH